MNMLLRVASAFAAGATAMYFLDPVAGPRRRALVRDKGVAARHDVEDFARAKSTHLSNRLHGMAAEAHAEREREAARAAPTLAAADTTGGPAH